MTDLAEKIADLKAACAYARRRPHCYEAATTPEILLAIIAAYEAEKAHADAWLGAFHAAADRIESLEAENKLLRGSLKWQDGKMEGIQS
jgi:truncated hemoglobin YjbI